MVEEFEGIYRRDFEVSLFTPDGSSESWWVDPRSMRKGRALKPGRRGRVTARVRVRGTVSAPGSHGHLGLHPRELRVTKVVSARRVEEPDEPWAGTPVPSARPSARPVTLRWRHLVDVVVAPDDAIGTDGSPVPSIPAVVEVRCDVGELQPVLRVWSLLAPEIRVGVIAGPDARVTRVFHTAFANALHLDEPPSGWPAFAEQLRQRPWRGGAAAVLVVTTASELLLDAPRGELATLVAMARDHLHRTSEGPTTGEDRSGTSEPDAGEEAPGTSEVMAADPTRGLTIVLQTAGSEADLLQRRLQADDLDVPRLAGPAALWLDSPAAVTRAQERVDQLRFRADDLRRRGRDLRSLVDRWGGEAWRDAPEAEGMVERAHELDADRRELERLAERTPRGAGPAEEQSEAVTVPGADDRVALERTFDAPSAEAAVEALQATFDVTLYRHESPMIGPWWSAVEPEQVARAMAAMRATGRAPDVDPMGLSIELQRNDPEPGVVPVADPDGGAWFVRVLTPQYQRADAERRLDEVVRAFAAAGTGEGEPADPGRPVAYDPDAPTAEQGVPGFLAPPPGARPYHGFVETDVEVDGFRLGMITDFLDEEADDGDAFVVAPDGSTAGLVWTTGEGTWFREVLPPDDRRWGVWGVGLPGRLTTLEEAREALAFLLPELRPRWEAWRDQRSGS